MRVKIRYKRDKTSEAIHREFDVVDDAGLYVAGPFTSDKAAHDWIAENHPEEKREI